MDSNEIFKQMTMTNKFLQIVSLKNIPVQEYEGENASVEVPSNYPFIQSLKEIARDYEINNADRTYQLLMKNLLKI